MPVKMIASRRFYLKEQGRDVEAKSEFSVPDDDAAERLERRHKAMRAPPEAASARPAMVDVPRQAPSEPVQIEASQEPASDPNGEPGHYQRRDMRAVDGRTGEETSAPSSRRGRRPSNPT